MIAAGVAFAGLNGAAAWSDWRTRRIPNGIVAVGTVLALVWAAVFGGFGNALVGLFAGLGLGFALFAGGAFGAGDGKFLAMQGAWLGWELFPMGVVLIGLAGGFLAVFAAARQGQLGPVAGRTGNLLLWVVTLGRLGARPAANEPTAVTVPYGVAIALGGIAAWLAREML